MSCGKMLLMTLLKNLRSEAIEMSFLWIKNKSFKDMPPAFLHPALSNMPKM